MRMTLLVAALLTSAGCLSRNTVGAEPSIDGGADGSLDDAATAMPGEGPIAEFEEALFGVWTGVYRIERRSARVRFTFGRDHHVQGCSEERCFIEGEYRVTDVLSDGSAIIQGLYENRAPFVLVDVVLHGDDLTFVDSLLGAEAELERVAQGADGEL